MDLLSTFATNIELFKKLNPLDCAVMIVDSEGIILNFVNASEFKVNVNIGSKVSEKGAVGICLTTGKEYTMNLPKEAYGIPIKSISIPIFDGNKIIGSIATSTTLVAQETLQNFSENMISTSEEITATTEEVASSAVLLSNNLNKLKGSVKDIVNEIERTNDILIFINEMSKNSKILGLNAAIESARAGEYGKGFAVVAKEMSKMSNRSENSFKDIKNILNSIQEKTSNITKIINETASFGEQQSIATNEIASAIQGLTTLSLDLEEISKII